MVALLRAQYNERLGIIDMEFAFDDNLTWHVVLFVFPCSKFITPALIQKTLKSIGYPGNSTGASKCSSRNLISSMPDTTTSGSVRSSFSEILPS